MRQVWLQRDIFAAVHVIKHVLFDFISKQFVYLQPQLFC